MLLLKRPKVGTSSLQNLRLIARCLKINMAAVSKHIEAAIRVEPGVLVLYAVAHNDDPTRVTIFEIYKDGRSL